MKAIILAAGKATRLLPLTKDVPQCMLKVGKKTILELQIESLKKAGVEDIIVITGCLSEKLEKFCSKLEIKTLFSPFYEVSGMALSLWVVKDALKNEFIFLYSDVLFEPRIIKELLRNKGDVCLVIKKEIPREEAEKVIEKEEVIKSASKAITGGENGEFIGIAKFSSTGTERLIKELEEIARTDLNASFIKVIDSLIKKREIIVTSCNIKNAQFIDIDFPKDLEKAEKLFAND